MDEDEQRIATAIEEKGGDLSFFIDPSDDTPSRCYSFGWSLSFGMPEMVAFGCARAAMSVLPGMFDAVVDLMEAGMPVEDGQRWPMEDGRYCIGRFVDPLNVTSALFPDALTAARLAGSEDPVPMYQLFRPDEDERFPWSPDASEATRRQQPLLYLTTPAT